MPGWAQVAIAIAATLTALGVIWRQAIKPAAKIISQAETTIPLLATLTKEWSDTPNIAKMLREIYDEFKTNGGSTLKDDIVKLTQAALTNQTTTEEAHRLLVELRLEFEVARRIGDNDRRVMEDLTRLVNVLDARVRVGLRGVADIQTEQHGVATDLASSVDRANREDQAVHGSSADAALRSTEAQKRETRKRHPDDQGS